MEKFRNKIICDDCIELLNNVKEPFVDLVFADPPFNIGYKYDQYHDKKKSDKYLHWTRDWMAACMNVLKPNGSFYIAIGDDYAANIRLIGEELGLTLRNWIIWHYTFGQQTKTKFARSHTHIFYFVKDDQNFTFNDHKIRVPSDRQLVYNDKRSNPAGKMPDDVWNTYARICGTFKERQGWHPCQMPEILLARIIAVSSNHGDLVLDPFSGSGTTAATALQLNRDYCGIEISENYVENTKTRLRNTKFNRPRTSSFGEFSHEEYLELKRLFIEVGIDKTTICENQKLQTLFAQQFQLRMDNKRQYPIDLILDMLKDFELWNTKSAKK